MAAAPSKATQRSAMGFSTVAKELKPWLKPDSFPPIPPAGEDDWTRGKGQTFDAYVKSKPKQPSWTRGNKSIGRNKIYLLPLGDAASADRFPDLRALAAGCSAFYGLECVVLPMMTLAQLEARGSRVKIRTRHKGSQVNANDINENLKPLLPTDGFTLCGVTMHDVWKGDFNYLFGLAYLQAHVGIFSFHRHQPNSPDCEYYHGQLERRAGDAEVMLRCAYQTLTHEIGHTFGLKHCVFFSCLMQGANSLQEAENRLPDLCPVCLRKLLWCSNAESSAAVRARYERLYAFFSTHAASFGEVHLPYVAERLGVLAAPPTSERCMPCDGDLGAEGPQVDGDHGAEVDGDLGAEVPKCVDKRAARAQGLAVNVNGVSMLPEHEASNRSSSTP